MVYTKIEFGEDLKWKLTETRKKKEITDWAFKILLRFPYEMEKGLKDILLTLSIMDHDPEFNLSIQEVEQLADDLEKGTEPRVKLAKLGNQASIS
jgi:hypothetical protein